MFYFYFYTNYTLNIINIYCQCFYYITILILKYRFEILKLKFSLLRQIYPRIKYSNSQKCRDTCFEICSSFISIVFHLQFSFFKISHCHNPPRYLHIPSTKIVSTDVPQNFGKRCSESSQDRPLFLSEVTQPLRFNPRFIFTLINRCLLLCTLLYCEHSSLQ